jgi:hypothetical protein
MILPPRVRWNKRALTTLDGQTLIALDKLAKLVEERSAKRSGLDGVAWGQYLDRDRYVEDHWGRYGTSAAMQVLHAYHVRSARAGRVVDKEPLKRLAGVLPRHLRDDWPSGYKPGDLERVLKLGTWVEALDPDTPEIRAPLPAVVERLLAQAVDEDGWSTRPRGDESRYTRDRLLPTAYILYALRRYPDALTDTRINDAYGWLGRQLSEEEVNHLSPDIVALCALAFQSTPRTKVGLPDVRDGKERADQRLREVATAWTHPRIDRPHFHGFNEGPENDYLFLSPELLVALYFLKGANPPTTRVFVLRVLEAVVGNVLDERVAGRAGDLPGFRVQTSSMMGTVDQMWAARVLLAYHTRFERDYSSLRPPRVPRPRFRPSKLLLGGIGVFTVLIGGALSKVATPVLGLPLVALGAVGALLVVLGRFVFGRAVDEPGKEDR